MMIRQRIQMMSYFSRFDDSSNLDDRCLLGLYAWNIRPIKKFSDKSCSIFGSHWALAHQYSLNTLILTQWTADCLPCHKCKRSVEMPLKAQKMTFLSFTMSCRREVVPMSTLKSGRFLLLTPMTFSPVLRARRISSACHGEIFKPMRHRDDGVTSQSIGQSLLNDQQRDVTFGG